ncbi:hypothetical protein A2U01_0103647 [Trifolium medium]|uniref:Uncharacterized protein n=1 Tax=Trifolium medium TaxID=97028 RepID=A0A392V4M0_9FABA|nr:hypothetical protein [Trifolium medium]
MKRWNEFTGGTNFVAFMFHHKESGSSRRGRSSQIGEKFAERFSLPVSLGFGRGFEKRDSMRL